MKKRIICLICSYILLVSTTSFAASISSGVREGNRLYDQEKYGEAIEKYDEAMEESPDSDILNFNLGAAQYKNGNYQEAVDSFTKALNTENKEIEAKAVYNIANTKYKLGSQSENTNMDSAIKQFTESLEYYKRSIDLDGNNSDAKYNHELVERELKVLLDRQKQQQQQKNEDNQDQDKKDQEQKDQQQESGENQEKQDDQQKQESQSGQDEKKDQEEQQAEPEQNQDGQQGEENSEDEQKGGSAEEETGKMSPEEAHMLLEAFGEEEAMEGEKKKGKGYYPGVLKDW